MQSPTPAASAALKRAGRPQVTVQTQTWGVVEFPRPRLMEAAAVGHLLTLASDSGTPGAAATIVCAGAALALRGANLELHTAIPAPTPSTWADLDAALDYGDAVAEVLSGRHDGARLWPDLRAVFDAWRGHLQGVEESAERAADFT